MALVPHLRATVDVEPHVVIFEVRVAKVQLACEFNLPQGGIDPRGEEHDVRVVVQVYGGEAAREDVDHAHHDQLSVDVVVLVVRAVVALGPPGGPPGRDEGGVAEKSLVLGLSALVLRAVVNGALVFLVQRVARFESGVEFG